MQDSAGNVTKSTDLGVVAGATLDTPITYAATFPEPDGNWRWRATETTTSDSGHSRKYEFQYDTNANLFEVQGDLSGTRMLRRFHEDPAAKIAAAPLSAAADGSKQILTHLALDPYGNIEQIETNGGTQCTAISYDPLFQQLPTSTTKFLAGCNSPLPLTTMQSYNRQFEVVTQSVGPDMTMTSRQIDLFGRVTHVFLPDLEIPGMVESDACTIMRYETVAEGPFQVVHTRRRDDAGGSPEYRLSWTLIDALGRTAANVAVADANNDPDPVTISGLAKRDAMGRVVAAYIPFFSTYAAVTSALPNPEATPFYAFEHDAFGRTTETHQLDGTAASRVVYHPLGREIYDATDLVSGSPQPLGIVQDGHGRTVTTIQPTRSGGSKGSSVDALITTAEYLPTGEMTKFTRAHTAGPEAYTRSMTYDSLGRLVVNSEPNTSGSGGAWTYAYDIGGQLVATSDARGCGVNYAYDGAGREVSEDYSPCLRSQPVYTSPGNNGDGTEAFFRYDVPQQEQLTDFGPNLALFRGKLASVADRAQQSFYGYDARGRVVVTEKQLAQPGAENISMLSQRYTPTLYRSVAVYDEANRAIAQTTGAEVAELQGAPVTVGGVTSTSVVSATYDNRDIPIQVGGSYGSLVTNEAHFGDGLIKLREYADAAKTTGRWSFNTNRLPTRAFISRQSVNPKVLLDATEGTSMQWGTPLV